MAVFQKFYAFSADVANKVHNLGADQLKVALTTVAPVSTNHVLADLTEISYTNLSSRNVTTTSCVQITGVTRLIIADLTLTAGGGAVAPFRYVALYNDTAAGKALIGFWDYGSAIALADGDSVILDADPVNGILQVS